MADLFTCYLGQVPYQQTWNWQKTLRTLRQQDRLPDLLLLVEHPPTYTCGRSTRPEHLPTAAALPSPEPELYEIERGGSITYHGPGQLVGYPILDLKQRQRDLHLYIRNLETALIETLADFNLDAGVRPGLTGVWVEEHKIAAIGVYVSQWITMHGFALNIAPELAYFHAIRPCGLDAEAVISMATLLGNPPLLEDVIAAVQNRFAQVFAATPIDGSWDQLLATAQQHCPDFAKQLD
ncbi:MAG: lipoyl(octanoyl) transferase LipB [Candidatus Latescibacteria bacterium]|nr:lipoyl(octanoyl) transferase LipB [Candidatus Latescibacterota bacterium]